MTIPALEQLEQLGREELLQLTKDLLSLVQQLQARLAKLEAELDKRRRPPAHSRNSSQPPSRDQKDNRCADPAKKKHGPPFGHKPHQRQLSEHPDQVIAAPVERCAHCRADLRGVAAKIVRRQMVELPPLRPVILETQQHEVLCPHCQQVTRGAVPEGLPAHGRECCWGPQLSAFIVYLRQRHHLSYERLEQWLHEVGQIKISQGGLDAILRRAGAAAQPVAEQIGQEVAASRFLASDETRARVAGRHHWQWVFASEVGCAHRIEPTRSAAVIERFMGEQEAEVWTSDCYAAQLAAPARHRQICLAHQVRDLERLGERDGKQPDGQWARQMQELFRAAIHWRHEWLSPGDEPLTLEAFLGGVAQIEQRCDRLLEQRPHSSEAQRLWQRYTKHREHLFVFLYYPEVEPTNNQCERALRPSVIHRKVTNGFRSERGARAYAALRTVIDTARLKGENILAALTQLMGIPVLHFYNPLPP